MPHAIFEYSSNLGPQVASAGLLRQIHLHMLGCGIFNPADVKSRAYEAEQFLVGEQGQGGSFAHVRVYLMEGRTAEQKNALSQPIFDLLRTALPEETSVTVDIRDLDKSCYKKVIRAA